MRVQRSERSAGGLPTHGAVTVAEWAQRLIHAKSDATTQAGTSVCHLLSSAPPIAFARREETLISSGGRENTRGNKRPTLARYCAYSPGRSSSAVEAFFLAARKPERAEREHRPCYEHGGVARDQERSELKPARRGVDRMAHHTVRAGGHEIEASVRIEEQREGPHPRMPICLIRDGAERGHHDEHYPSDGAGAMSAQRAAKRRLRFGASRSAHAEYHERSRT